jgi:aspartate-semialdehyde dehydrogenase
VQIAFNVIPHIGVFLENGYTIEEMKMLDETRKIFNDYSINVSATTVRVPVFTSHSESLNIETKSKVTVEQVRKALKNAPGITLKDDFKTAHIQLHWDSSKRDDIFVEELGKMILQ